jgi:hypothetical protein
MPSMIAAGTAINGGGRQREVTVTRTRRTVVAAAALTATAIGLVGVGAGASFTDSARATERISTGTLCIEISSVDENGVPDGVQGPGNESVTFELTNTGSQIDDFHMLTLTNTCTLPLLIEDYEVFPLDANDAPLRDHVIVNINGINLTVHQAQSINWVCGGNCVLNPGDTDSFVFAFTGNLTNVDQGQSISPTIRAVVGEVPAAAAASSAARSAGASGPAPAGS